MRAAKLLVLASTLIALWVQAYLGALAYSWLPAASLVALVAGAVLGATWRHAVGFVVGIGAIVPVATLELTGHFEVALWLPWLCLVTGAMLRGHLAEGWSVPGRWRWPLVCWAVGIALTWPILVARELDFNPAVLWFDRVWTSRQGGPPKVTVLWIAHSASVLLVSLLWLDALCARYRRASAGPIAPTLLWPLAAGVFLSNVPALIQGFHTIDFLNRTVFAGTGRAAGAMLDGNAFGMLAAAAIPLVLSVATGAAQRNARWIGAIAAALLAGGVWATASRTALLAAVIGAGLVLWTPLKTISMKQRIWLSGAAVAMAVVVGFFVSQVTVGPVARMRELLPGFSGSQIAHAASQLWNRGNYGTSALMMIEEHPLAGVGVGGFNMFVPDYSFRNNISVPSDNAQNWYRHQLAELGVLGSIPWLALIWVAFLEWRRRRAAGDAAQRGARAAVLAVAVASLLGVPTQNPVMCVAFASLLFAALLSSPAPPGSAIVSAWPRVMRWTLAAATVLFIAATAWESAFALRPFIRASAGNWLYEYGLYPIETREDGGRYRWTAGHAVTTVPSDGNWLLVTIRGGAPDAAARPVRLRVWHASTLVFETMRRDDTPITLCLPSAYGQGVPLRIDVDRTFYPSPTDHRPLGVALEDWAWADAPPPGAIVVK